MSGVNATDSFETHDLPEILNIPKILCMQINWIWTVIERRCYSLSASTDPGNLHSGIVTSGGDGCGRTHSILCCLPQVIFSKAKYLGV